jgi:Sulfotransferase family
MTAAGSGSAYRIAYLAGTGRSGSTLVAQLLAVRSGAAHVGEVRYLWTRGVGENHLCECGRPFDQCDFWVEVLAKAYGDDMPSVAARITELAARVDRMRHIPQTLLRAGHGFRAALAEYGELLVPLYDAIASVSGAELIIDSSKDPSYLFALDALDALDVRAIHLVRDSRAVAYSWTRKRLRPEIHWTQQYMNTRRPWLAAVLWTEYNAAIELYKWRRDGVLELRYEDFVAEPERAVQRICDALGVVGASTESGTGTGTVSHSLSGNPMRFDRGPLVVRPDTEWAQRLPARDRRLVTALTAPLLRSYGYRLRTRRHGMS